MVNETLEELDQLQIKYKNAIDYITFLETIIDVLLSKQENEKIINTQGPEQCPWSDCSHQNPML